MATTEVSATTAQTPDRIGNPGLVFLGLFGVLLPLVTLVYELLSDACADTLFDPIPTVWHGLLVALVPLANGMALSRLRGRQPLSDARVMLLLAIALGVEFYYALVFLPLTPFSALMILAFGLGLMPLSPLISLLISLYLRYRLRRSTGIGPGIPLWLALPLGMVLLSLAGTRDTLSLYAMQKAASADPVEQARGVQWLRRIAGDDQLLPACLADEAMGGYAGVGTDYITNPAGLALRLTSDPVAIERRREVYYRVTGMPCPAVDTETWSGFGRGIFRGRREDWVQPYLPGLQLQQSRIHSRIRPRTATSYSEWTLWFRNDHFRAREARVHVLLPPGGVVSRLTLRVKGEEQEAAYAQRKKVEKAYREVVARRRDPVLVTTSGPDRVLVQAFPVPPAGGTMKVRIGITAPLISDSQTQAVLRLPSLQQRNFDIPADVHHQLRIDAPQALRAMTPSATVQEERRPQGAYRLSGRLPDAALANGWSLELKRAPGDSAVWVRDPRGPLDSVIEQDLEVRQEAPPRHIVLLIDSSRSMAGLADAIADALKGLPKGAELSLLVAGDTATVAINKRRIDEQAIHEAAEIVRDIRFVGGADSRPALLQALELASSEAGGVVFWLHGEQPLELDSSGQELPGLSGTDEAAPRLVTLALRPGRNRLADALDGLPGVRRLHPPGFDGSEIGAQLARWRGEHPLLSYRRQQQTLGAGHTTDILRDDDVARLWALHRVGQLAASERPEDQRRAVELAASYQIVTPVSGAVVLENAGQYQQAGLTQVDPRARPGSAPEPGSWWLLLLALALLSGLRATHRSATDSQAPGAGIT